jgi:hypothetical protein
MGSMKWKALYSELEAKLRDVYLEEDKFVQRTEKCIKICEDYIDKLRALIVSNGFTSEAEEIDFFKCVKPKFASKLMYNIFLFNLEYRRPRNQSKAERKYLQKELKKINEFFEENTEFYKYYKTERDYLDHRYFVRGVRDVHLLLDTRIYYFDQEFTTSHGHLVASILAYEQLVSYIEKELKKLEKKTLTTEVSPSTHLNWTESKVALTELIYAIHSTGAVNNGKVDISELVVAFESIFNIELNNYYRSYLEIKIRKSSRTKFIDELKQKLMKRMDEDDDR